MIDVVIIGIIPIMTTVIRTILLRIPFLWLAVMSLDDGSGPIVCVAASIRLKRSDRWRPAEAVGLQLFYQASARHPLPKEDLQAVVLHTIHHLYTANLIFLAVLVVGMSLEGLKAFLFSRRISAPFFLDRVIGEADGDRKHRA